MLSNIKYKHPNLPSETPENCTALPGNCALSNSGITQDRNWSFGKDLPTAAIVQYFPCDRIQSKHLWNIGIILQYFSIKNVCVLKDLGISERN